MRKEITWISPLRTGIIYAVIIAVVWVVIAILRLIFVGMGGMGDAGIMVGGGIMTIIVVLVMGAVGGFIGGVIGAFIYNIAAGIVGGVVIEFKDT